MRKLALLSVAITLIATGCASHKVYFPDGVECNPYELRNGRKVQYTSCDRQMMMYRQELAIQASNESIERTRQVFMRTLNEHNEAVRREKGEMSKNRTQLTTCESYAVSDSGERICVNPRAVRIPEVD